MTDFWKGFFSVFCFGENLRKEPSLPPYPFQAKSISEAFKSDWEKIGQDFNKVIEKENLKMAETERETIQISQAEILEKESLDSGILKVEGYIFTRFKVFEQNHKYFYVEYQTGKNPENYPDFETAKQVFPILKQTIVFE